MIEISEKVLVKSLKVGLEVVKNNERLFDRIFSKLNRTESQKLKQYLNNGTINVTQGYPMNRAKLPCYAILLGGENEDESYVGDYASEIGDLPPEDDGELVIEERLKVRKKGELVEIITSKKNVVAVTNVSDSDGNTIDLSGLDIEDSRKGIISVFGTDLDNNVEVDVSYVYKAFGVTAYGAQFNKQYRIEVWAPNGDLSAHLYHLLKWILLFSRDNFYKEGWVNVRLGGADLEPVELHEHESVFRRAASISFSIEETYELEDHYIQEIQVLFTREGGKD